MGNLGGVESQLFCTCMVYPLFHLLQNTLSYVDSSGFLTFLSALVLILDLALPSYFDGTMFKSSFLPDVHCT